MAGEVTTLAHFNEQLGIWSCRRGPQPRHDRGLQEPVRGAGAGAAAGQGAGREPAQWPDRVSLNAEERPSERLERTCEYQQLVKHYPEIIEAAARDDGLDISDALVSRLVNKANPWDYGVPRPAALLPHPDDGGEPQRRPGCGGRPALLPDGPGHHGYREHG